MKELHSFAPPKRILMGPGPSDVSPRVLAAMAQPTIGHLDPAFVRMMDELKDLLRATYRTENSMTLPISGPGSIGMETCFANLIEPGDTVVVCQNGVFGGRMKENVVRMGGVPVMVENEWGRAVSAEDLEAALIGHPEASVVAFVHAETSTGALSDAETLAALARRHGCLTIMDAVTSLGGVPVEIDGWEIDAVYSGTQKCLSVPPGLSPVSFSEKAMDRLRARKTPVQSWFGDLSLLDGYWAAGAKRSYHHTAPVNALYGLHEGLLALQEEGLEAAWARHRENHEALRVGLEGIGIDFVVPVDERLPQLNAVSIPDGVPDADVRGLLLEEFNLEIGAGLGALAGKVWRIGLMGTSSTAGHVELCVKSLSAALSRLSAARA
ncbi:MAG: alanine--glyoxylate aminotransferase family protein [Candidatus Binatia bacterium]|nr:alanine--glyoxylate aminotransferase family protein [Candidatus Binatia bacterium]MDG1957116.1 alanine--glyoxylate aminotransferase family protein [Candidatus Binatia bacterium]MDG2011644.1 alanine--glyoxylate aminotransferase family protein [Candidatus Binatia bacterium]